MKRLSLIYHSKTGNTERLARAALEGAREESTIESVLTHAFDAGEPDILSSQALIFATPENFGYMSGALKDFFDRTYDETRERVGKLPYGILISAGNDGRGAKREIERIATGYGFRLVAEPVIVRGEVTEAGIVKARELGQGIAAGLELGIF